MVSSVLSAPDNHNSTRNRAVITFGLGGVAAGLASVGVFHNLAEDFSSGSFKLGLDSWLLSDFLLFLGFIVAFVLCKRLGWLHARLPVWRWLVAAIFVTLNGYCGLWAGLLVGFGMVVPLGEYMGNPVLAALPVIFGIVTGIFGSVFVLSLALYVLGESWNINGWVTLMMCGVGAAFASIAVAPGILRWSGANQLVSIETFYQSLVFLTHTLYGGSAGYWLVQNVCALGELPHTLDSEAKRPRGTL